MKTSLKPATGVVLVCILTLLAAPRDARANGYVEATGGNEVYVIVEDGVAYWVHKFTSGSSEFEVISGGEVEYLIVGGGGGVGDNGSNLDSDKNRPGGGGGGGVLLNTSGTNINAGTHTINVAATTYGTGNPSSAFGLEAPGGGKAGHVKVDLPVDALDGTSGGGGGGGDGAAASAAGSGTPGLGYDGGTALVFADNDLNAGGGGGGAGGPGSNAYYVVDGSVTNVFGGDGGPGVSSDIDGTLRWYGGGGGGGAVGTAGVGGIGGGSDGFGGTGNLGNLAGGAANTGGGAGASRRTLGGTGVVVIRYKIDPALPIPIVTPFTVSNIDTGSTEFTNTNKVNISDLPDPVEIEGVDYDRYQITDSDDPASIDPAGWKVFGEPLDSEEFTTPLGDGTVTLYAWYTNATDEVIKQRAQGEIVYTTVAPVPVIVATLERGTDGYTVRVTGEDLDAGSTSGDYEGEPIGIYRLVALDAEGQASNQTPDKLYFTADGLGSYSVRLKVINMAGNYSFSAPVTLEVEEATDLEPGEPGDLYVALGNLHAEEPYGSWTNAAATIQAAVDHASDNATIWVAPAIYYGTDDWHEPGAFANVVNITKPVHLRGAVERERVIIDGYELRRGVRIANSGAVVERFTIRRGWVSGAGAGVNINPGTLRGCLVTNNIARGTHAIGGGIAVYNSGLVDDCDVIDNQSIRTGTLSGFGGAGGIEQRSGSTVRNSRIMYNTANGYIGGGLRIRDTGLLLCCSVVVGNSAIYPGDGSGIGLTHSPTATIRNSLIADNYGGRSGGGIFADVSSLTIQNSTIAGNTKLYSTIGTGAGINCTRAGANVSIENSIVYGNTNGDDIYTTQTVELDHVLTEKTTGVTFIGDNNITDRAPEFVDAGAGNYRLAQGSPCINAGFNQEWMDDATDLDGRPRLDSIFNEVDLGAYEFVYKGSVILFR